MKTLKILLSSVAIAALVTTVACKNDEKKDDGVGKTVNTKPGDKTADTKPVDEKPETKPANNMTNEQKAEAGLKVMSNVGKIFADHAGDCDGAAEALTDYVGKNKAMLEKSREWGKDPEFKKLFAEKYKEKLTAAMKPMMGAVKQCNGNKNLEAAMAKFAGQ